MLVRRTIVREPCSAQQKQEKSGVKNIELGRPILVPTRINYRLRYFYTSTYPLLPINNMGRIAVDSVVHYR